MDLYRRLLPAWHHPRGGDPLLPGGELLWHMRRSPAGKLPEETARRCLGAVLQPLRYMQEQGVLYRDLKPTNLIFSRAGRLTLVDLAHAKRIGAGSAEWLAERSDSVCGTPHYHAPETVRGDGHVGSHPYPRKIQTRPRTLPEAVLLCQLATVA